MRFFREKKDPWGYAFGLLWKAVDDLYVDSKRRYAEQESPYTQGYIDGLEHALALFRTTEATVQHEYKGKHRR